MPSCLITVLKLQIMASIELPFSVCLPVRKQQASGVGEAIELQGGHGGMAHLHVQALGHTGELKRIECNNLM